MTKSEAINFFGGASNLARALGLTPHAIYQWPAKVPARAQWPIAVISNFNLLPDSDLLPKGVTVDAIKSGSVVADKNVSKLLVVANELSRKGRGDVLEALITMANHNL